MAQRISRAKQRITASGVPFRMPTPDERPARLRRVLRVLYLIFNEGYASSSGGELQRAELSDEAIRLARMVHAAAARRRRGRRPARPDAPDRRPPPRPDRRRRRAGPAGRTGPSAVGSRAHRRGDGAARRRDGQGAGRRVPAAGRDRGAPRPGGDRRRHGLAADPRAVRAARADDRQPRRDAQPGGRGGHGRRARRPGWPSSTRSTSGWPATTASTPCARTCSRWPATRTARRGEYPRRRRSDDEPAGAALPGRRRPRASRTRPSSLARSLSPNAPNGAFPLREARATVYAGAVRLRPLARKRTTNQGGSKHDSPRRQAREPHHL